MVDLVILEIISLISFLYSIVLMFTSIVPFNEMVAIFIFTVVVSTIFALYYRKSVVYEVLYLLVFLPAVVHSSKRGIIFFVFVGVLTYIYIKKALERGNHRQYVNRLRISYGIYAFLMLVRTPLYEISVPINNSLVFIVVYLVSSIILVRLQRHIDSKMDIKKIRKTNIRYLLILALVFLVLMSDGYKTYITDGVNNFIDIVYYPMYLLTRNLDLTGILEKQDSIYEVDAEQEQIYEGLGYSGEADFEKKGTIAKYLNVIVAVSVLIAAIIIILFIAKLFIKGGEKKNKKHVIEYVEEREFIKDGRKKKQRILDIYPHDPKEQVRYYYRKYLRKVNNVSKIESTDTSLDVNNKAVGFNKEIIEKIRNIYINIRYGNKEAKEDTVKEIENLYNKL